MDWDSPALRGAYAERVLGRAGRAAGCDVARPAAVLAGDHPGRPGPGDRAPGGAIYGSSSNGARSAFLRPPNRAPVRGLFLVGGSTHPGGGLPLVVLSARIVDRLIGPA